MCQMSCKGERAAVHQRASSVLWLTAEALHLLFSFAFYNPSCVTVLQHDVFAVRLRSDGTCLHLN